MNLSRLKLFSLVLGLGSTLGFANQSYSSVEENKLVSKTQPKKYYHQQKKSYHPFFFEGNIGVGFLYFSGVKGNIGQAPLMNNQAVYINAPISKKNSYNRTPSFEYNFGTKLFSFLKTSLSYQHQGNVTFQTDRISASTGLPGMRSYALLTSNLSLDGFFLKFDYLPIRGLRIGKYRVAPQISAGVGPSWLSWTQLNRTYNITVFNNARTVSGTVEILKQKINPNVAWTASAALNLFQNQADSLFSLSAGCRYTWWGQARNIGALDQQGSFKLAIFKPLSIRTIYQFAPFLGFQWNFPTSEAFIQASNNGSYKKRISWLKETPPKTQNLLWTQSNVGLGLLYFDQVQGNLQGVPTPIFRGFQNIPLQKSFTYNRTPLFEYLVGTSVFNWLDLAVSFQNQSGVIFQTQAIHPKLTSLTTFNDLITARYTAYLSLNSLMLKALFKIPYSLKVQRAKVSSYLAFAGGSGWQSWTQPSVTYTSGATSLPLPFKQKFAASAVWMAELGLKMQPIDPSRSFSFLMGCRYNQWGQARNIGKLSQQENTNYALYKPFKIKMIYQFAPFLGFQWNFGYADEYYVQKNKGQKYKRFIADSCYSGFNTQFNVGLGFLYFDQIRLNLGPIPDQHFTTLIGNTPIKGHLSKTPSILYEYLLAYQIKSWLNVGVSYQYQPYSAVQTRILPSATRSGVINSVAGYFSSNLNLNALALKGYVNSPLALRIGAFKILPYLGVGVGASWQSWTRSSLLIIREAAVGTARYTSFGFDFKQKVCANAFFMVDAGLKGLPVSKNKAFSLNVGCKYNQWGQARNIAEQSEQGSLKFALFKPLRIKMVYQFAPYFGFQWNF